VQPDGAFSPNARAPSGKIRKNENSPYDHPANPTGWSFFDRNFLLKRFRKQTKRFRKKCRKPLKTQEWKRLQRKEWRIRKNFL
jgi:acetoacetate decarboxylase